MRHLPLIAVALVGLLTLPAPAGSATPGDDAPRAHRGGVRITEPLGGARAGGIPRLVRAGSDRRAAPGAPTGSPARVGGALAPTSLTTFDGLDDSFVVSPADPIGALGATHHLAAVNVEMAFFDRVTGAALDPPRRLRDLDPLLPPAADDFDPKVVYDAYREAFLLAFASSTNTQSFLTIVVIPEADVGDESQWCPLHMSGDQVTGDGKQLADYPMLGITEDRVTLATNQFDYAAAPAIGPFQYVQLVSFDKADLYDCAVDPVPIELFGRAQTRDPDGSQAFTIVPAISTGGAPPVQYLASIDYNGVTGKLILWRLRSVNGNLRLGRVQVSKGAMAFPPWGRQCGSTTALNTKWDTGDLRLTSAFWDGELGRLYTATAIQGNVGGGGVESVVRWWEVDPAATLSRSTVPRKANVGAAGRDLAWPSVATDGDGKLWVNYARAGVAGADECLSAYAAVVQPGQRASASLRYREGEQRYEYEPGPDRWGDYTGVSRDPVAPSAVGVYGAVPIDDGAGTTTRRWRQVIGTLQDV